MWTEAERVVLGNGSGSPPVIPSRTYPTLLGSLTLHGGMGGCRFFFSSSSLSLSFSFSFNFLYVFFFFFSLASLFVLFYLIIFFSFFPL